jgi:hypothetical protein
VHTRPRIPSKVPYVYGYIAQIQRTWAEVILNHVNLNVPGTGQREVIVGSTRGLNLTEDRPMTSQLTTVLDQLNKLGHNVLHKSASTEIYYKCYLAWCSNKGTQSPL